MKMKKVLALIMMSVLLVMMMFTGCNSDEDEKEETGKIRIGTNRALGTVTPLLAQKLGYFDNSDIEFEIIEFADGTALMEAMAAGELDMGFVGVVPIATWVARGTDIKIVAGANGGGHVILSKESTGIKTIADLKDHSLATPSVGTVTDVMLRAFLLKEGNVALEDMTVIPGMKPADMATSLEVSGEVEAIMTWEPFASQAEQMYDDITVVADTTAVWKEKTGSDSTYPVNAVCVTGAFINNHKDELTKVLAALEKTVDYINGENHDDAVAKIAEILSVDKDVIENACKRTEFSYALDWTGINKILNWAKELDILSEVPGEAQMIYKVK